MLTESAYQRFFHGFTFSVTVCVLLITHRLFVPFIVLCLFSVLGQAVQLKCKRSCIAEEKEDRNRALGRRMEEWEELMQ